MDVVVKTQETREGVRFRVFKDNQYKFYTYPFKNYFYVKTYDYESYKDSFLKEFKFCVDSIDTVGKYSKIILSNNFMRSKVRNFWEDRCHTFEADIKANKRFLLTTDIALNNTHIPYTFYDIETDDRKPLIKDDRGRVIPNSRILSFAATNYKGESIYYELTEESDEAEKDLLLKIIRYLADYGIISGWYSEFFDMPFIKGRCDLYDVSYKILDYVNHLDYKDIFQKYDKKSRPSYSLNAISNQELKESKIDQEKGNGAIYNTWLTNKEHLKLYNIEDTNLIYKINKKLMFIEVSMKRADNAKCDVRSTVNNSDSGDYLLMRAYHKAKIIMPSQPTKIEILERKRKGSIGGGYTTCFEPGLHDKVRIFDFKSEYPSVIQTWNIDPTTFIETIYSDKDAERIDKTKFIVTPSDFEGGVFHPSRVYRKEEGIIPQVVRKLVEDRDKIKYPMAKYKSEFLKDGTKNPDYDPDKYTQLFLEQYALKTDSNSIYGILGFPASRYYSWELGDSVTTCARATLKHCNETVKEHFQGVKVIGGDTDSTFIILPKEVELDVVDKFFADILEKWGEKWGCVNNKLVFEYEKTFDKMLFVKKKHYAYIINGEITIKGLEAIKSDTNKFAATLQREFIEDLLRETYKSETWSTRIGIIHDKVFNLEMNSEELALIKALTKMPQDYEGYIIDKKTKKPKIKNDGTLQKKTIPAHVKLAKRLIGQGQDINPGSKIKFIVIKDKPNLAISIEEYDRGEGIFPYKHKKYGEMDYHWEGDYATKYYWLRIMKPLIKVIYAYYNDLPDWEWRLTDSERNKILVTQMQDEDEDDE